jgi:hypothetical protein
VSSTFADGEDLVDMLSLKRWNREDPDDRSQWNSQHNGLLMVPEPYVYHVVSISTVLMKNAELIKQQRGNQEQLQAAMRKAIDTPVDRYIRTLASLGLRQQDLLTMSRSRENDAQGCPRTASQAPDDGLEGGG